MNVKFSILENNMLENKYLWVLCKVYVWERITRATCQLIQNQLIDYELRLTQDIRMIDFTNPEINTRPCKKSHLMMLTLSSLLICKRNK